MTTRVDTILATFEPSAKSFGFALRLACTLLATVLTAVAAQMSIHLPFTPVPFTLQPVVVLLSGAVLGARLGLASQLLYLAAGIAGLPVFAVSPVLPPGALRLIGPTGGYLMCYPIAAWITGLLAERGFDRGFLTSWLAMLAGLAVIFTGGVLWLARFAPQPVGLDGALHAGLYPFLAADLMKISLAALLLPSAWRLLRPSRD